jgi:hypothetical protein
MQNIETGAAAIILLALAGAMVAYEELRKKAKRPLFDGREVITLYWVGYLTFFVLGLATGLSALIR